MTDTDDIFDASGRVRRASDIGVTDSSQISCAFAPGPVVRDKSPVKKNTN